MRQEGKSNKWIQQLITMYYVGTLDINCDCKEMESVFALDVCVCMHCGVSVCVCVYIPLSG